MFETSDYLMLVFCVVIVLFIANIRSVLQYIRMVYLFNKFDSLSFKLGLQVMLKLLRSKDNELFDVLNFLLTNATTTHFSIFIFWTVFTAITDPKDLERFLSSSNYIVKGCHYDTVRLWLREGLLTSQGNKWHRRRKILTPTFHFKILQESLKLMNNNAKILVENLSKHGEEPVDIASYISHCTLDIICETAMGIKLDVQKQNSKQYVQDIDRLCALIIRKEITFWMQSDIVFRLTPTYREMKTIISRLHAFTEEVIANRKEAFKKCISEDKGKHRMAFLDCLIDSELNEPGTFSDLDMREEVDTFMFEGHDTTASAVIFCLFMLSLEKHVQEKVVEELDRIFGEDDRSITRDDLQEMKYLEMVIKETLRLYPAVPYFSRHLTQDFILEGGKILPAGSEVGILPYIIHKNPTIYPNPEIFDPERFNEENSKGRSPFAYIPFSAGPRNCIGQKFVMMELKIIISTILRKSILEPFTKKEEVKVMPQLVLRPDVPIKIKFICR